MGPKWDPVNKAKDARDRRQEDLVRAVKAERERIARAVRAIQAEPEIAECHPEAVLLRVMNAIMEGT